MPQALAERRLLQELLAMEAEAAAAALAAQQEQQGQGQAMPAGGVTVTSGTSSGAAGPEGQQ